MKDSDFDRYAETFFDIMHEGHDYESVAKGYGEYYYDCLPKDLKEPVLDVGCGSGHFLRFLEMAGYQNAEGIEISSQQAKLARQYVTLEVHDGDVADLLKRKPAGYAAICMNDVLEH
ncbi:MAG: methyltransferase domain-containing protein, partial [Mariprofundaceae bacterium]|nr:methyltransferase domain-containing protein [Mariprofundaceae bacterium]